MRRVPNYPLWVPYSIVVVPIFAHPCIFAHPVFGPVLVGPVLVGPVSNLVRKFRPPGSGVSVVIALDFSFTIQFFRHTVSWE